MATKLLGAEIGNRALYLENFHCQFMLDHSYESNDSSTVEISLNSTSEERNYFTELLPQVKHIVAVGSRIHGNDSKG